MTVFRPLVALLAFSLPLLLSAQCCDHILVMQDSYGDGWNGGTLQVLVNGSPVGTFSATGYGSNATFTVCNGDQLQLVYAAADWENENTYHLFDQWGNPVFSDGPNPAVGMVYNGLGDCTMTAFPGTTPCAALPIDTADCVIANNSGILGSGISPGCANYQGGDIWYSMTVPPSGNLNVTTFSTGGLNDTGIAIWTGTGCFDLTLRGCDDDGGPDYFSLQSGFDMPVGETFYIQAFGYGGSSGAFQLCVADPGLVTLESSELPIVLVNTLGQPINNEVKIDALMEIKYNGAGTLTYITDPANVYTGHIGIEGRGQSSAGYPQRPYAVETRTPDGANNNVSLLGWPAENDWVLLSNYNDRSLMRNQLAFELFSEMGEYAPRTHLCEVLVDSVYKGIYLLGESIKRDNGRVHIAKLTPLDNTGDQLTGGYILGQDYWNSQNSFQSNYSPIDHPEFDVHFLYRYPRPADITIPQRAYIASFVDSLETALYSSSFGDPITGYRQFLDVSSFINYFLVNEVSRNNDGFKKSVYFHKDRNSNGGKLKAGPVWDFDWAWKDLASCEIFSNTDGSGWAHHINDCFTDNYSCGWYIRLLQDPAFRNELRCTYDDYRSTFLNAPYIHAYMDSIAARVQNAQARHFQKWPLLGVSGPAPELNASAATYAAELDTLKAWIDRRLQWLDQNIPGVCTPVSVMEAVPEAHVSVYPNPSNGQVHFQGELTGSGTARLLVKDVTGRLIHAQEIRTNHFSLVLDLPGAGTYLYHLQQAGEVVRSGRLIIL
jgi:hypothetical protein